MYQPADAVWELCAVTRVSLCLAFEECESHTMTITQKDRGVVAVSIVSHLKAA